MASHAFITSWLMAPGGAGGSKLGTEWSVGFRGQTFDAVRGMSQVMTADFSYTPGGGSVGISPSSSNSAWINAFPGSDNLGFCGYYWWRGKYFGGFIDWWPITSGNRHSRGLENADGQFEKAGRIGIKKFAFCITDMHGRRTNIGYIG